MPQRLCYFLVVFLLIFSGENFGQKNPTDPVYFEDVRKTGEHNYKKKPKAPGRNFVLGINYHLNLFISAGPGINAAPRYTGIRPVSPSFYSTHLGFFCQKELALEKISTVRLRVRLGSLDYVNYLEQKPNARKPLF